MTLTANLVLLWRVVDFKGRLNKLYIVTLKLAKKKKPVKVGVLMPRDITCGEALN